MKDFKVGDRVRTTKGCRIAGRGGAMHVFETGKRWGKFDAVLCQKQDGTKRLYLEKNLVLTDD